jgi:F-type H+-transporting ATPase subunit alpha
MNRVKEIGYVTKCNSYLVYLEGLPSVHINSIIEHESGSKAMVTSLDSMHVQALMLDKLVPQPGDSFSFYKNTISIPVGENLFGRVINPLGVPLDNQQLSSSAISEQALVSTNIPAPGINKRHIINQQHITGISTIDSLLPIGKGQRELIMGEPRSGKTAFIYDLVLNQKKQNTICIYCAIGKSELAIKGLSSYIQTIGADTYTIIVAASSSTPAPLITLAPTTALTIAEYFRDKGKDVLLILDDMGLHAKYIREIALLGEEVPGRDSYPGSIFHQHARIVERAGNFLLKNGGTSSVTLLPIVEIVPEATTSYITTNLMSMTDGHLLFSSELIAAGQYPAVDIFQSVTRVGRQTQNPLLRSLSDKIRVILSRYEEIRTYTKFGSELSGDTINAIKLSETITELLRQEDHQMRDIETQIIYLTLPFTTFFAQKDIQFIRNNKHILLAAIQEKKEFKLLRDSLNSISLEQLLQQLNSLNDYLTSLCQ